MAELPLTQDIAAEMLASQKFGLGSHADVAIRSGAIPGRHLGFTEFDSNRHLSTDIDPLSLYGMAMEQAVVPVVEPTRPLTVNIIADYSVTDEHPAIAQMKQSAIQTLSQAVDEAMPGMTDRAFLYAVGENTPKGLRHTEQLGKMTDDEARISAQVGQLATEGLTVVISDFQHLQLPEDEHYDELIAIKVNHPLERFTPRMVGLVSLGGLVEINTNNRRQVAQNDAYLAGMHQEITGELEEQGAAVASLILEPKAPQLVAFAEADQQIAAAFKQISHKKA